MLKCNVNWKIINYIICFQNWQGDCFKMFLDCVGHLSIFIYDDSLNTGYLIELHTYILNRGYYR